MRTLFLLTKFFAVRRLASGAGLLLSVMAMLLLLSGFLSTAMRTEGYAWAYEEAFGGVAITFPVQDVDIGSAHSQVWAATNFAYLHSYPIIGGALLPLRLAAPWLFILLPFVGMLATACGVSGELETGVAQTLYGTPVRRAVFASSRILGDSLAISALISLGILVALAIGGQLVDYEIRGVHLARCAAFAVVLALYTSIFVQVGNLISALSRRSAQSLWVCVIAGLAVIGIYFSGANLMAAARAPYPTLPTPPAEVNRLLSAQPPGMTGTRTAEQLAEAGGATLARYLIQVNAHADHVQRMLTTDYQHERWYGLVSPVHAVWEIAQQLLQDRHGFSTELLAPVPAMEPPPSIRHSLLEAFPEIAWLVALWIMLLAMNIRTLTKLEV